jgi:hypothetical protein
MNRNVWARSRCWCAVLSMVAIVLGCGDSYRSRAVVKGQVTIGGKNLTAGTVEFHSKAEANKVGVANIDANGNYTMSDAPIGEVMVAVRVPKMTGMAAMTAQKGGAPPTGVSLKDPSGQMNMEMKMLDPSKIVQIPDKYGDFATSGLTHKVEKGETTHNITLTP